MNYKTFFENSADAMLIVEDGEFVDCNPAAVAMLGYDRKDEILHMPPAGLSPEFQPDGCPSVEKAAAMIRQAEAQGSHRFEWNHLRKDGTLLQVEVSLTAVSGRGGMQLHTVWRDISGRKQAEETLKESEERFRSIFNAANDALFIQDLETWAVLDVNLKACELYGMSREEALRYDIEAISAGVPPYTAKEAAEWMGRAAAGEPQLFEWRAKDKAGRLFWVEVNMRRACIGSEERLIVSIRDITERKQAEQAQRESEERFRQIAESMSDWIWEVDPEGVYTYGSSKVGELLGYRDAESIGKTPFDFMPPGEAERVRAVFHEVVKEKRAFRDVENWNLTKDGRLVCLSTSGTPILGADGTLLGYRGVDKEITERKRIEEERGRLMAAIEQVAEAVVITDAEGTVEYVNPAFERVSGYAHSEIIGKNPRILQSGEQDAAFYQAMWKTLRAGETWIGRFCNRKKDGSLYTEEATISPVKDGSGATINYVGIKMDITAELAREERLRQAQKMESVGRLAGGVAHDFNNILQTITGFCGLLLAEMDPQSTHRQDVVGIQTAVRHAGDLTRQLLAFSRKQPTEYRVVDLDAVLSDGRKMIQQALDKEHRLELKLASALQTVKADAVQLLQVAMNLVVNARDAMPDGGEITLFTQPVSILEKDLGRQPDAHVGEWVCLSVADAGCGMDERQLEHLFEPFFTTKRPGEGTGLGLSVVYGIVKEHGGWIHVDSEPGHGSVFKVYLPRHTSMTADSPAGDSGASDGTVSQGNRILLVEDDHAVGELAMEILLNIGYRVDVAGNVREAKDLFAAREGAFDLLFSDVVLPDGNGIELADTLLERKPGLPVLLFSGYSDGRARVALIEEKGFGYMHKPFNLKKLLDAVAQAIGHRNGEM